MKNVAGYPEVMPRNKFSTTPGPEVGFWEVIAIAPGGGYSEVTVVNRR
jgi:hypothetical protein